MLRTLHRHPQSSGGEAFRVEVDVTRQRPGQLLLRYLVTGPQTDLRLPPAAAPQRTDELWRHTCFEAFVRTPEGDAYYEFNLAPSCGWAAYRFEDYRSGMAPADTLPPPALTGRREDERFELDAVVDVDAVAELPARSPWRVGISAVLEDSEGRISYWALAHPAGKPDFHHLDGFVLELPATEP
ncbi:MAG TPA: DOMON-like domain-containing protein [Caulobacteraceae bacterium]